MPVRALSHIYLLQPHGLEPSRPVLSMKFSSQELLEQVAISFLRGLPYQIEPAFFASLALAGGLFTR